MSMERRAHKQIVLYLLFFVLLTVIAAILVECVMRFFSEKRYDPSIPLFGLLFLASNFIAAFFQYRSYKLQGGKSVAESMGARCLLDPSDPKEVLLLNIVKECATAFSLVVPKVYIIEAEQINVFTAGMRPENAVIAITQGAVKNLSQDELRAVVAHEFGHIINGDMKTGMCLSSMLISFYFILYFSLRVVQATGASKSKFCNPVWLLAMLFLAFGDFTWLFGSILKSTVSRKREYLADASAIQFTHNPEGLVNALLKIQNQRIKDMPKTGLAYSHLYLDDHGSLCKLLPTHPPLNKRIAAIKNSLY